MDPVLNPSVTRHVSAAKITRQSKSNLALAFISLGRERKRDISVFYAFCRVIDDIADDEYATAGCSRSERRSGGRLICLK